MRCASGGRAIGENVRGGYFIATVLELRSRELEPKVVGYIYAGSDGQDYLQRTGERVHLIRSGEVPQSEAFMVYCFNKPWMGKDSAPTERRTSPNGCPKNMRDWIVTESTLATHDTSVRRYVLGYSSPARTGWTVLWMNENTGRFTVASSALSMSPRDLASSHWRATRAVLHDVRFRAFPCGEFGN